MKGLWIDDDWCFQRIFSVGFWDCIVTLQELFAVVFLMQISRFWRSTMHLHSQRVAQKCELTWCFCKDPFLGKMGFDSNGKPVLQISWTCARGAVEFLLMLLHPFFDDDNHQHGDGDLLFPMLFQTSYFSIRVAGMQLRSCKRPALLYLLWMAERNRLSGAELPYRFWNQLTVVVVPAFECNEVIGNTLPSI